MNMIHLWSSLARLMDYSFSELETYVGTVQSALEREKEHFNTWLDRQLSGLDEEAADERAELYAEDFSQLSTTFPDIARRSAFLAIYSTFEYWLLALCWQVQKIEKQPFGPRDMKGDFFGARIYLERLAGIRMARKPDWQRIVTLREIRNKLVHEGGNVRRGDMKFLTLVNRTPDVTLDDQNMVTLTNQFCIDSIATIRTFLGELVNDLRAKFHD